MAKKSFFLFFTITVAGSIIEPILTADTKNKTKFDTVSTNGGIKSSVRKANHGPVRRHESIEGSGYIKTTLSPSQITGFTFTKEEMEKFKIWPDGVIPYYIDVNSFSDKVLRDTIRSFLNDVNSLSSINFIEYPSPPEDDETRWVFFINRRGLLGCADHSVWNFTTKGVQRVILGYDCMIREGELAEAVLSIAGIPAQHTAPDRDEFIKVYIDNVIPEKRKLFDKLPDGDWLFHNIPYDYNSAGHYHNFKYSENGGTVIEPVGEDVTIGETKVLSDIDILKIRLYYDYITKKRRVDAPECDKLFKVGKCMKKFKPDNTIIKPNIKPRKYKPVPDADVEYIDIDEKVGLKQALHKGKKNKIRYPKAKKQDLLAYVSDHSREITQLKAKIKAYDPLGDLSDYTSNNEDKRLNKIKNKRFETLKAAG